MSAPIQVQALATSLGNLTTLVRSQEKLLLELVDKQKLLMKGCEGAFREINQRLDAICPYNIDVNNNAVDGVGPGAQDVHVQRQVTFEEPQAVEEQIMQEMQQVAQNASIAEELAPPAPVVEEEQLPVAEAPAAPPQLHYDSNELLRVRGGNSHVPPVDVNDQEAFRELAAPQQPTPPNVRLYQRQGQLAALAVPLAPTTEEPQQLVTSAVEHAWTAPQEEHVEQQQVQQPVQEAHYRQTQLVQVVQAPHGTQDQGAPAVATENHQPAPYPVAQPQTQRQEDARQQQQQQWNNGGAATRGTGPRGNGGPRGGDGGPRGGGHPGNYGPRNGGSFGQAQQGFAKPSFGNGGGGFNGNNKPSLAPSNNNGNFANAPATNPSPGFANSGFGNGGGFRNNQQQPQQHRAAAPRDNGFQQQQPAAVAVQQQNRPFAPSGAAPQPRSSLCVATRGRGAPRNAFLEQR